MDTDMIHRHDTRTRTRYRDTIHGHDTWTRYTDTIYEHDTLSQYTDTIHIHDTGTRYRDTIHGHDTHTRYATMIHGHDTSQASRYGSGEESTLLHQLSYGLILQTACFVVYAWLYYVRIELFNVISVHLLYTFASLVYAIYDVEKYTPCNYDDSSQYHPVTYIIQAVCSIKLVIFYIFDTCYTLCPSKRQCNCPDTDE